MNDFMKKYDRYENEILNEYREIDFFKSAEKFTDEEYIHYLLQLGHFSFQFINWIQAALLGLENQETKEVARHILQEECPLGMPSHQEERAYDLNLAGISKETMLDSKPTTETLETIARRFELIRFPQNDYDLKTLVALRFDGEILAGETFGRITREFTRRFGIDSNKSRYYSPHFVHDQKYPAGIYEKKSHADSYFDALNSLIKNEEDLQTARKAADACVELRKFFHRQFI